VSTHYVLKIQYVNKPVETRNIEAPVTVLGREAGDIVLGDPQSSGRHAEIHFQGGQVSVKDLGSTNGTFFNGQRLMNFQIGPGQSFSIGQTVFTVMAVHGAAASRGPAKTMIAMGGAPPRPPGPGAPPPGPSGFGAPPRPAGAGAPPPGPAGFGAPPPAAPASGGFGAPVGAAAGVGGKLGGAPASNPPGAAPQGFGGQPAQPQHGGAPQGFGGQPAQPQHGGAPQGFGGQPAQPQHGGAPQGFGGQPAQPQHGGAPQGWGGQPAQPQHGGAPSSQPGNPYGAPAGGQAPPASNPGAAMAMAPAAGGPMAAPAASHSAPAAAAPQSISMPAGAITPKFHGTGGEVFGQLFVGGLLTVITAGIYAPWFMVKLINYVMTKTEISGTAKGTLKGSFTGTGGQLFVHFLVGYLLMIITLGIYTPWFICRMLRWGAENFTLTADDGTTYKLRFDGTGGALFGTFILGALLMIITLYIYTPWFMVKLRKWLYSHMAIMENGQEVGKLDFVGTGGSLFGTMIVGAILTVITLYIYFPWFQCKLNKYWATNTRIQIHGRTITPDFVGTGGELFVIGLLAVLLGPITLGIYYFWVIAKLLRFNIDNHQFNVSAGGQPSLQA